MNIPVQSHEFSQNKHILFKNPKLPAPPPTKLPSSPSILFQLSLLHLLLWLLNIIDCFEIYMYCFLLSLHIFVRISSFYFIFVIWLYLVLVAAHGIFNLCCGTCDLQSLLRHLWSSDVTCELFFFFDMWTLDFACGISFPGQTWEPLLWKCGVLATGPPGKSLFLFFFFLITWYLFNWQSHMGS